MFVGLIFLFFDITIPMFDGWLDFIPDAIGWSLIYADMKDCLVEYPLGRDADENTSLIFVMLVVSIVVTILRLFVGGFFFHIANIIKICIIIFAWMFVNVVESLEYECEQMCNAKKIRNATVMLTITFFVFYIVHILFRQWIWGSIIFNGFYQIAIINYLYNVYCWDKS